MFDLAVSACGHDSGRAGSGRVMGAAVEPTFNVGCQWLPPDPTRSWARLTEQCRHVNMLKSPMPWLGAARMCKSPLLRAEACLDVRRVDLYIQTYLPLLSVLLLCHDTDVSCATVDPIARHMHKSR